VLKVEQWGWLLKQLLCSIVLFYGLNIVSSRILYAEEVPVSACVRLDQVSVNEHELFNEKQQKNLFSQYIGQCIDGKILKALVAGVSSFYMDRGYITTRAYLESQNIQDGQIDISVLKGFTEAIVDADTKKSSAKIKTAFAFQKGEALNLRDIETALEMMNRPTSSQASFTIEPGSKAGSSVVEVKAKDSTPYHLKLGVGGRKNLNDKNLYMTGEFLLDNPLNINDIFKVSYNGSRVQKAYQSNNGVEINYSFPIASYLLEVVGSDFSYRQGVNGVNDTYLSSGDTQGVRVRLNKVLFRNQKNKLNVALSVLHKNTKNYFVNQLIEVSSYRTSLAQADLTHTYVQSWGQLSSTYSYYQGTDWFGARTDHYISAETGAASQAKLQFIKHSLDTNLTYYFKDRNYKFNSNAHIQYSNDLLYDNDKLTVGSDYTVRGYSSFNLFGNNAWYVKNDLSKTWQVNLMPSTLQSVSASIGLDYGEVRCERDNLSSCGSAVGTAVGLSSQGTHLHTNLVWSRPLKKINTTFKMENLFIFDATWEF